MKKVVIYSDGGCHGNPGPGGWAAVLAYGTRRKEISGGAPATTNNRMELQAAIAALGALQEPCEVEFHTDSQYVKNGITRWLPSWKRNGWRTAAKQPVKNADLWRALDAGVSAHQVRWHWVKGHAGQAENERCDELAGAEIEKIKAKFSRNELKALLAEFTTQPDAAPPPEPSLL